MSSTEEGKQEVVDLKALTVENFESVVGVRLKGKIPKNQYDELLNQEHFATNIRSRLTLKDELERSGWFEIEASAPLSTQDIQGLTLLSLEEVIFKIYQLKSEWKSVLDRQEDIPVDSFLRWTGRAEELLQLERCAFNNITEHLKGTRTKQSYRIPLVHGGVGVGKSRLVSHFTKLLERKLTQFNSNFTIGFGSCVAFNDKFKHVAHIFLDLYGGDHQESLTPSVYLGTSVAAHFLFGVPMSELVPLLNSSFKSSWQSVFDFSKVIEFISTKHTQEKQLLLTIQMDEFSEIGGGLLNEMLRLLTQHCYAHHQRKICILPHLTGTGTKVGIEAISASSATKEELLLQPWKSGEETQLCKVELVDKIQEQIRENSDPELVISLSFLTKLLAHPLFEQAIECLGRVPRYFQWFIVALQLKELHTLSDMSVVLSQTLKQVTSMIRRLYGTENWKKFLGGDRTGVRTMVLWSLAGKTVSVTEKLNGITIQEAQDTGILMLQPVLGDDHFTIFIPLILLRAFNADLEDVPDEYLDPVRSVNAVEFERVMSNVRILRQNMMFKLGKTGATLRELYPFALGYDEDLDTLVDLRQLEQVFADGSSGAHDSFHTSSLNAIKVLQCSEDTIDAEKKGYLVHNVPMAPSNDAIVVHRQLVEGLQFKSSDNIRRGKPPSGGGVLSLGRRQDGPKSKTIWGEFNKVIDLAHNKFYGQRKFILAIISNKPLTSFSAIKENLSDNDFPRGVIVISYDNFQGYAGPFSHSGLFQ